MQQNPAFITGTNHPQSADSLGAMYKAICSASQICTFFAEGAQLEEFSAIPGYLKSVGAQIAIGVPPEEVNGYFYAFSKMMLRLSPLPIGILEAMDGIPQEAGSTDVETKLIETFEAEMKQGELKDYQNLYTELLVAFRRLSKLKSLKEVMAADGVDDARTTEVMNRNLIDLCFSPTPDQAKLREGIILFSGGISAAFGVLDRILQDETMVAALKNYKQQK